MRKTYLGVKMKKIIASFLTLLSITSSSFALETIDKSEINQIISHFTHAWNECNGQGSADFYAKDADFVNIFGITFSGKDEIESRHVAIHQGFLKESFFEVIQVKLREAKSDIVIAHVKWKVSNLHIPCKDMKEMNGIFTHVLSKTEGKWEIIASQNTPIHGQ